MFTKSCSQVQESVYGVWARTNLGKTTNHSNGTGFKISEKNIVTCSHILHQKTDVKRPLHKEVFVIRAPDIGNQAIKVKVLADDPVRDVALLEIDDNAPFLTLDPNLESMGTICGSIGFPLCTVKQKGKGIVFDLTLRFQGAHISANYTHTLSGSPFRWYETDSLMYKGSSGCPGFLSNGIVWGMQQKVRVDPALKKKIGDRSRLAISIWLSSIDIIEFARKNGLSI